MSRPTVILSNYHGLAIRNFGHTGFPGAVSQSGRLMVLSDSAGPEEERENFGAERLDLPVLPESSADHLLQFLRKDTFFRARGVETYLLKEARLRRRPVQRISSLLLRQLPGLSAYRLMDRLYAARLQARPETRKLARTLVEFRPCVLLDILHNNMSGAILRAAARQAGVPICGFIQSWDKLTTKHPIHGTYDHYLVWSNAMKRELLSLYPWVREAQVSVTGSPQFDYYYYPEYLLSRADLCRELKLDPHRPILTYTTVSVGYSAGEDRVLEVLIRTLQERLGDRMPNVVIRPRPNPLTPNQERFHELEAIVPGRVRVMETSWNIRTGYDGRTRWGVPNRGDMVRYTSLMRHTDVGLAISSTTVLEWLLCDRPVVNLCFDPNDPSRPDPVSRWMVEFTHYRFIREGPGVAFTEGLIPAVRAIEAYLEDPSLHSDGRRQMRCEVLGWQDGRCGERIAARMLELAADPQSAPPSRPLPPTDPALLLPALSGSREIVLK